MPLTGPVDDHPASEALTMYRAVRRQLPQDTRQQARREYKIRYLFNLIVVFPEEVFHYGRILTSSTLSWACWVIGDAERSQLWRYRTHVYTVALARYSLNMTAYQAGTFSARWGLFINAVSRVGSRALLHYYKARYKFGLMNCSTDVYHPALHAHSIAMAMWTRALCIYRCVKLAFAWPMHRVEDYFGKEADRELWNLAWRHATCQLLESKLNIAFWEVAIISPDLAQSILFPLSATVRLLVEHRLLRGPLPQA